MTDRGPRRVVARDREQDEEGRDLAGCEHVLAEVVVHQRGGEVVLRVGPPLLGQLVHEPGELDARTEQRLERITVTDHVGVTRSEDHVRRLEHRVEVAARDPHHVADHEQRERL